MPQVSRLLSGVPSCRCEHFLRNRYALWHHGHAEMAFCKKNVNHTAPVCRHTAHRSHAKMTCNMGTSTVEEACCSRCIPSYGLLLQLSDSMALLSFTCPHTLDLRVSRCLTHDCRRALGAAAAAAALSLAVPQGAQAIIKGYEPMAAIKGKDYGKERQRCAHPFCSALHCHVWLPQIMS